VALDGTVGAEMPGVPEVTAVAGRAPGPPPAAAWRPLALAGGGRISMQLSRSSLRLQLARSIRGTNLSSTVVPEPLAP
jgi:hypothetical protein